MNLFRLLLTMSGVMAMTACTSWLDGMRPLQGSRSSAAPVAVLDNQRRTQGYVQRDSSGDLILRDQTMQPRKRVTRERDGSLTVRDHLNRPQATLGPRDRIGLRAVRDQGGRLIGYTRSRDGRTTYLDPALRPGGSADIGLDD